MAINIGSRLKHAWNAFRNNDPGTVKVAEVSTYTRPDRPRVSRGGERSIVVALLNRIAVDVASIDIKHVRLDDEERFIEEIDSNLNYCLQKEANLDQTGRAFVKDFVFSMLDEGCIAVVPVDTTENPFMTQAYDVLSLRVGKIVDWYPTEVKVELYNDRTGKHEQKKLPKHMVAIIENPFYPVMNAPSSTMQRLIRKLAILDSVDEETGGGKLQMIIQLPYIVKSENKKRQAEERLADIQRQLTDNKLGIAYADGTEKVIQLNRPLENNLQEQIEYLTNMLYGQMGLTPEILNGSANEETMLNYYNRTIEPICSVIIEEFERKWLSKTARTQRQAIRFFRDPFKLVPVAQIAEMADKFTRNEIMTSNEFRQVIGMKPSADPKADQLVNSNIAQPEQGMLPGVVEGEETDADIQQQIADIDENERQLDELEAMLK